MPSPTAATSTLVHTPGAITPHHSVIPTTLGSPVAGGVATSGTGGVGSAQVSNTLPSGPAATPGKPSTLQIHR